METSELIKEFLSLPSVALIGASQIDKHFGNTVYKILKKKSFKVFPVNPKYNKIGDDICYPDLNSLPEKAAGIIIITSPTNTDILMKDIILSGINYLWIQQGSETKMSIELALANNINVISKKCILMFAEPVEGFHKFHRIINKFFGILYK